MTSRPGIESDVLLLARELIVLLEAGRRPATASLDRSVDALGPSAILDLARLDLLTWCRQVLRVKDRGDELGNATPVTLNVLWELARSFARSGDLEATCVVLQALGRVEQLEHAEARVARGECVAYLLRQMAPDGHFGLVSEELKAMPDQADSVTLSLTLEVLWALTELYADESVGPTHQLS